MKGKVLGAGFCDMTVSAFGTVAEWRCYGESTSLNVVSRGSGDSEILNALVPPIDKTFDLNSRVKSQR